MFSFASSRNGSVEFINCQFINNILYYILDKTLRWATTEPSLIKLNQIVKIELINCNLYANSIYSAQVLQTASFFLKETV